MPIVEDRQTGERWNVPDAEMAQVDSTRFRPVGARPGLNQIIFGEPRTEQAPGGGSQEVSRGGLLELLGSQPAIAGGGALGAAVGGLLGRGVASPIARSATSIVNTLRGAAGAARTHALGAFTPGGGTGGLSVAAPELIAAIRRLVPILPQTPVTTELRQAGAIVPYIGAHAGTAAVGPASTLPLRVMDMAQQELAGAQGGHTLDTLYTALWTDLQNAARTDPEIARYVTGVQELAAAHALNPASFLQTLLKKSFGLFPNFPGLPVRRVGEILGPPRPGLTNALTGGGALAGGTVGTLAARSDR